MPTHPRSPASTRSSPRPSSTAARSTSRACDGSSTTRSAPASTGSPSSASWARPTSSPASERREVIRTAVDQAAGRVVVWVGVRALRHRGRHRAGARGRGPRRRRVFVAPIAPGPRPCSSALPRRRRRHPLPVAIHDYPAEFGITIPADLIGRLANDGVTPYLKAEDPPVLVKQRRVLSRGRRTHRHLRRAGRPVGVRRARERRGRRDDRTRLPRGAGRHRVPPLLRGRRAAPPPCSTACCRSSATSSSPASASRCASTCSYGAACSPPPRSGRPAHRSTTRRGRVRGGRPTRRARIVALEPIVP
jgi:hypothetical protein